MVNAVWPVFVGLEPSSPDNCITVYDTVGEKNGRVMTTGEMQLHHGIQVRIRAVDHPTGFTKARAIAVALDEEVYGADVFIDDGQRPASTYRVHSYTRRSGVFALGDESPNSKRQLFTVNLVTPLEMR